MIRADTYGAVNWVDLATHDLDGSTRFYHRLLGWRWAADAGSHLVAWSGSQPVAGIMEYGPGDEDQPAVWTPFFYVADLVAALRRVRDAGGSVLAGPISIPGDARVGVVSDPAGAMLALIAGPGPGGVYLRAHHGAVCRVDLLSTDPAASQRFLEEVLGWRRVRSPTLDTVFRLGSDTVAAMRPMPPSLRTELRSQWLVGFGVVDHDRAIEAVESARGHILAPADETPGSSRTVIADPEGALSQIVELAPVPT